MLMMFGLAAATLLLDVQDSYRESGNGPVWHSWENRDGAVLRRGRTVVYLGRSCDAFSPQYGRGRWGAANGGVLIVFARRRIGFPRQGPPVTNARCDVPD